MARGRNPDAARIAEIFKAVPPAVKSAAIAELNAQADKLVADMKSVAAEGKTHNLAESVRKEPGKTPFQVIVKAGGPLTTKPIKAGQSPTYDYALSEEFSNEHKGAQPFFFNTYRFRKKRIRSGVARKMKAAFVGVIRGGKA